jgi:hypothetical protein
MAAEEPTVQEIQFLTTENKKANAAAMILFSDEDSQKKYIFLIQKEQQLQDKKQEQLQTPGGKVKATDAPLSHEESLEEKTYLRAAIREACEEICGHPGNDNYKKFEALLNKEKPLYIVNAAERQKLSLRAENGPYDTRTICFYLGKKKLEEMRAFLKTPDPNQPDAKAAYIAPCETIVNEKNPSLMVTGQNEECTLLDIDIRITTITILHHKEGVLSKIQENFAFSESYSRGTSPTHFQPAEKETIIHEQKRHMITPQF